MTVNVSKADIKKKKKYRMKDARDLIHLDDITELKCQKIMTV